MFAEKIEPARTASVFLDLTVSPSAPSGIYFVELECRDPDTDVVAFHSSLILPLMPR